MAKQALTTEGIERQAARTLAYTHYQALAHTIEDPREQGVYDITFRSPSAYRDDQTVERAVAVTDALISAAQTELDAMWMA